MTEKIVGILGGMGPEATLNCFAKILAATPADRDQDHLRIIIDNNPKIPDRTSAILTGGESPAAAVVESCRALERAGADFIIIPCVTVHYFYDEFSRQSPLPILSILDAAARAIVGDYPDIKKVGLMATDGTVKSGIFQKRLSREGMEILTCADEYQKKVMDAIYLVKSRQDPESRRTATALMREAAQSLIDAGAESILAGCTEIPLILGQEHIDVPYFDSLLLLAGAAVKEAGMEPK